MEEAVPLLCRLGVHSWTPWESSHTLTSGEILTRICRHGCPGYRVQWLGVDMKGNRC